MVIDVLNPTGLKAVETVIGGLLDLVGQLVA